MSIRTYVWKAADLTRAWDQLTDFAKDVTTYINQQRVTADIANGAVTSDKLAPVPFLSLVRDAAFSAPNAAATLVPMTILERSAGRSAPLYDGTNGRAIIQLDGLYRVSVCVHCTPTAAPPPSSLAVGAVVNGTFAFMGSVPASLNTGISVCAEKTVRLLKDEAVELRFYQDTGVPQALTTASADRTPRLQIEYVGGL